MIIKRLFTPLIIVSFFVVFSLTSVGCPFDVVVEPPNLTFEEYDNVPGGSPSDWGSDEPYVYWDTHKPKVTYNPPTSPKVAPEVDINELKRRIRISENALKNLGKGGDSKGFSTPSGCFAIETLILTADGERRKISDIVVGDRIKGYDLLGEAFVDLTVIEIHRVKRDSYFVLNNIRVTAEHPFYTDRIWSKVNLNTREDRWVEVKYLVVGTELFGGAVVESIKSVNETDLFFNVTVDGVHNFFVVDGDGNYYLVHNKKK